MDDVRRTRVEATKRCLAVRSRSGPGRDHARDTLMDTARGQLRHERRLRAIAGPEEVKGCQVAPADLTRVLPAPLRTCSAQAVKENPLVDQHEQGLHWRARTTCARRRQPQRLDQRAAARSFRRRPLHDAAFEHYYNHWPDPELERHAKRMADLGEPIQEPFDR